MRARLALSAAALLTMTACSAASAPTSPSSAPFTPVPQVSQGPTASSGDASKAAQSLFEAMATNDPDTMDDAHQYVAKGSVAEAYLQHLTNMRKAFRDGGDALDEDTLTASGSSWKDCPTDGTDCVTWSDVVSSGMVVSNFKVNDQALDDRVSVGSVDTIKAGNLADVTFLSSYRSVSSKAVFVTLKVKTKGKNVTMAIYDAKYRDPEGDQTKATQTSNNSDIDADSTTTVYIAFKGAKVGGTVSVQVLNANTFEGPTIKIKTR